MNKICKAGKGGCHVAGQPNQGLRVHGWGEGADVELRYDDKVERDIDNEFGGADQQGYIGMIQCSCT